MKTKTLIKLLAIATIGYTANTIHSQTTLAWKQKFQTPTTCNGDHCGILTTYNFQTIDTLSNSWYRLGSIAEKVDLDPSYSKLVLDASNDAGYCTDGECEAGEFIGTPYIAGYDMATGKAKWAKKMNVLNTSGYSSYLFLSGICPSFTQSGAVKKGATIIGGGFIGKVKYDTKTLSSKSVDYDTDLLLLKTDANGNYIKSIQLKPELKSDGYITFEKMVSDGKGGVIVLLDNAYSGKYDIDPTSAVKNFSYGTNNNIAIVRYDNNLNLKYGIKIEGNKNDLRLDGMSADKNGNLILTGMYNQSQSLPVDFDPSSAKKSLPNPGGNTSHYFMAKYSSAGSLIWVKSLQTTQEEKMNSQLDASGNLYVFIDITGMVDIDPSAVANGIVSLQKQVLVAKYSPSGTLLWNKFDAAKEYMLHTVDAKGNLYIMGAEIDPNDYTKRIITKYKTSGQLASSIKIKATGGNAELSYHKMMGTKNSLYVSGFFEGSLSLHTQTLNSSTLIPYMCKFSFAGSALSPEDESEDNNSIAYKMESNETTRKIAIYPNPANEQLNVSITLTENETAELSLLNVNGALVKQMTLTETATTLNISYLPAGMYFVEVVGNNTREVKKIVKH